ncbi:MAG: SDR family NAD(P)-dependent oxidoreductase, partial [Chloracidobacterium sp.]|nr:SDR family NAD(P)-dependent oxidoreductase [Chloracidobacterium sp.]
MTNNVAEIGEILELVRSQILSPQDADRLLKELKNAGLTTLHGNGGIAPKIGHGDNCGNGDGNGGNFGNGNGKGKRNGNGNGDNGHSYTGQEDQLHRAVVINRPGKIADIQVIHALPQDPGSNEAQIHVKAFSLNFGDLLCIKGLYPTMPDYPFTPGFEVSGVVLKTGRDVIRIKPGDEVIGLAGARMGGHSSFINLPETSVVKKPANVTHEEACSFPIAFMTMRRAFDLAAGSSGETILIQTAAGGTGLIAVQLARLLNLQIIATAGSVEKLDYLFGLGVRHVINYRTEDFAERVLEITGHRGVDIVFNTLSGSSIQKGLDALAPGGRYVEIAMTGLKSASNINLSRLTDNQTIFSLDLRRMLLRSPGSGTQYMDRMVEALSEGKIKSTVGRVFKFSQIKDAYRHLEDRSNIGKIVITTDVPLPKEPKRVSPSGNVSLFTEKRSRDIAVIGVSGRFPGAKDLNEFWRNLAEGQSSISQIPPSRWDINAYYDPDPGKLDKTHCGWGGFLDEIDQFDPVFFNLSGREAQLTDPQQRLFLEESWKAIEDAGYAAEKLANTKCGIFVGAGISDYLDNMLRNGMEREAQSFWGNEASVLASRLSYFLNLKGASIAVNTACSSSLVAIHLACQSLLDGESSLAIAGGVFIRTTPDFHIINSNAGMLSPDGKCKTFDDGANGYVPGEGVGVLALKSLDEALRDNDNIYGVIKATGINHDGRTNGITAPSALSQTALELSVYEKAGINPETLTLIEAHGTGTKLGDPIEVEALTNAFRKHTARKNFCAIGSVKTNIGHTVAAAGVAGVIKVLLALKHKAIPPTLNFTTPNRHINFADSPFYVNDRLRVWKVEPGVPRRAAVSSFGFSGTNAHLIIEEAPKRNGRAPERQPHLITLSAKTSPALKRRIEDLIEWLESAGPEASIGDLAFTLLVGRSHFAIRAATVASSVEQLREKLRVLGNDENSWRDIRNAPVTQCPSRNSEGNILITSICEGKTPESEYEGRLNELADLYMNGSELNWEDLYSGGRRRRISIPNYPFMRKRYWIPETAVTTKNPSVGLPLIDGIAADQTLSRRGVVFQKRIHHWRPIAAHHQVLNQSIIPGVGHIEMALEGLSQIKPHAAYDVAKVVWLQPLIVDGDYKDVEILIDSREDRLTFHIQSERDRETIIHSQGEFHLKAPQSHNRTESLDIDSVKARCVSQSNNYGKPFERLQAMGISYGSFFQAFTRLWQGDGEAIGLLELPQEHEAEFQNYILHPTIMDGALQTTIGLMDIVKGARAAMPFSVEKIETFNPLKKRGYAYLTPGREKFHFNVTITDESGLVCVRIHDIAFREIKDPLQNFFYLPGWRGEPLSRPPESTLRTSEKIAVVFSPDAGPLREALIRAHSHAAITSILLGSENRDISHNYFEINALDRDALDRRLEGLDRLQAIYFLGGFSTTEWSPTDNEFLENSQELGVVSLFRLVKSLLRLGYARHNPVIKVITNRACEIHSETLLDPISAGLSGFCKSLAREQEKWRVRCLDVDVSDKDNINEVARAIIDDPIDVSGKEIALRDGRRYVRTLLPLNLPPPSEPVFKRHGVYVVLGGAGGIGFELSCYLAEKFQARMALIGRTGLNESLEKKIKRIESLGGEAAYFEADASMPDSLGAAVGRIKARFGTVNGVFHSALALHDKLLENLDESGLRAPLAPKVAGSVALYKAFEKDPLDFFAFFSSSQSFIGNLGQSNYAAACAFKDAYARYLRRFADYPIKIINWGYWGDVGAVATEEHHRRLSAKGIQPIKTPEGIEAISRILASHITQVMPVHASRKALEAVGVDYASKVQIQTSSLKPSLGLTFDSKSRPSVDAVSVERSIEAFDELDKLGRLLLLATFRRMSVFKRHAERYTFNELKSRLGVADFYDRLLLESLRILTRAGLLERHQAAFISSIAEQDDRLSIDHLELLKQSLQSAYPEVGAHTRLLWTCATRLPQILRGDTQATDVIFPNASMELVRDIYQGNYLADHFNKLVAWRLRGYLERRVPQLKENEKIRIIEIGAGTGGTSKVVFDAIRDYAESVVYDYTDISKGFTRYGQKHYGEANAFAEFKELDVERSIEEQGFEAGGYEIAIAANALHATRRLGSALEEVKRLLKTNGWLILNEVTAKQDFTTMTFGLLDGWWIFEDEEDRIEGAPVVSREGWETKLKDVGYEKVESLGEEGTDGRSLGQNVIIAESNGVIATRNTDSQRLSAKPLTQKSSPVENTKKQEHNASNNCANTQTALRRRVEDDVVGCIAEVLQLDKDALDRNAPFSDFGVDSLLAVEIVNKLNQLPTLDLRSTDLFNYSNIAALVDHIIEVFRKAAGDGSSAEADDYAGVVTNEPPADDRTTELDLICERRTIEARSQDIAIIGVSARFPDANNIDEFWRNLLAGRNSVREITRWDPVRYFDPSPRTPNKSYSRWAGLLQDIERFDAGFFKISPREAELMDPQQRAFLEEAWKAIEDAGYSDRQLDGIKCGVFVGCGAGDYTAKLKENRTPLEAYTFMGNSSSILAARVSYLLNLKGPCVPIDTACSSSLVALHIACDSLRYGSCDTAIIGGVTIMSTPEFLILGSRGGMLSPEGKCKTFDQSADGFAAGEAV